MGIADFIIIALITEFDVKADVLVSMALIASIYVGEYDAAGIVAFIMQIGGYLEQATVRRARSVRLPGRLSTTSAR